MEFLPTRAPIIGMILAGVIAPAAWLLLSPEVGPAVVGYAGVIGVVLIVGFGLNACRVMIDHDGQTISIVRSLTRKREVIPFANVASARQVTGRGAGIWISLRHGADVAIPYAGLRHGKKLFATLSALKT